MSDAAPVSAGERPPPARLGAYEIIGEIARGGMGTVYLACRAGEAGFQRLFAVKAMHPHLAADQAFIEMLGDEARLAARLHHHNVVPVVDLGTDHGVPFVAMEYVEGCSLSALLARTRERPAPLIVPILIDALEGLHAAHVLEDDEGNSLRLVHRDVSPQNVLVGTDGTARLIDFGIAKAEARVTSTRPGQWKGKFAYMAPEQLVSDDEEVDHRADIFAAGAVLWTALTGSRLFRGETDGATVHNVLNMPVPPPSSIGCRPPEVYDAICLRALHRDREQRFASAHEMAEALRALCSAPGSRAEIAEWVRSVCGAELSARRDAIRAAAQRSSRTSHSALRVVVPAPASVPPPLPAAAEPPPVSLAELPSPAARSRKPWLWVLAPVALAVGAALAFGGAQLIQGASASRPTDTPSATRSAPPVEPSAAAVTAEPATAPASSPVASSTPSPRGEAPRPARSSKPPASSTAEAAPPREPKPAAAASTAPPSAGVDFEKNPYLKK